MNVICWQPPMLTKKCNNCLLVYYLVHVKSYRQSSSDVTTRFGWFEFHAFIQRTPKVIAQKARKFGRQRDEWWSWCLWDKCSTFRYLSHVRIWAKYFQTVLPLSFELLWEYRALVYFLELALILCWLVDLILYALRQLFVITQSLFKPPFIILYPLLANFEP
jgi:hypothetical protein